MSSPPSFSPAALPPEGVVPNFQHPRDVHYTTNIAIAIVCLACFNVLFFLHVYVKWRVKRGTILLEDWFCTIAWAFVNGYIASIFMRCSHGEGRSLWELSLSQYQQFLQWLYIGSVLYSPAAFFTKVTLLLLMARIFSVNKFLSRCIHIFIAILAMAYLPIEGLKVFICRPVWVYWQLANMDASAPGGKCFDQPVLFMCDILIAIITDFIILILPVYLVWSMDTSWQQKIKYIILLGAGGGATATTMMRAYYNVRLMNSENMTADVALSSITSSLELAIGMSCACLPSASLLFKTVYSAGLPCLSRACPRHHLRGRQAAPCGAGGKPSTTTITTTTITTTTTTSSHWSSIMSKITMRTVSLTMGGSHDSYALRSGRRNQHLAGDVEYGLQMSPAEVVFNHLIDLPSIGRSSGERSRPSTRASHHGPSEVASQSRRGSTTSRSPSPSPPQQQQGSESRKGSFSPRQTRPGWDVEAA